MLSQKRLNNLVVCFIVGLVCVSSIAAQGTSTRPRRVNSPTEGKSRSLVGPRQDSFAEQFGLAGPTTQSLYLGFNRSLLRSIESLLGTPYNYGANGDGYGIDCSGFVWRVYRNAGLSFVRTSALEMFVNFPEATDDEKFQFGTLVFFNNLTHVGIVKDANSFYHASRSQGVTLSQFKGYWEDRIVGYRVVEPFALGQGD